MFSHPSLLLFRFIYNSPFHPQSQENNSLDFSREDGHALVTRRQIQEYETDELITKMYDGAADGLVAALLGRKRLSTAEIQRLRALVEELDENA